MELLCVHNIFFGPHYRNNYSISTAYIFIADYLDGFDVIFYNPKAAGNLQIAKPYYGSDSYIHCHSLCFRLLPAVWGMEIPGIIYLMMKFENIHNIIIFRALQLGDMLCAIPAIRALRNAFPDARIVLAGLPWAQTLTQRFPHYFDSFFAFPGYPGLPEQIPDPAAFTDFLKRVQNEKFDLAIQMQGNGSVVNPMVELFGARYTAGFCVPDHYFPDNGLFMPYPDAGSEISRHVKLMYFLDIPSAGRNIADAGPG